jgi:hypothetical protein
LEWRVVEDEIVALDVPAETYLGVNRSGSILWQALAKGATHEELTQLLVSEFGLPDADAEHDVAEFLSTLQAQGVLESGPE